jgi:threonine dehydrogenase-like Zn-dependent dehydrogenase
MKAITIIPGTKNLQLAERPEPSLAAPDEVKIKILTVGICGTDREEASGGRARAPEGRQDLVLGHEMLGKVVSVGDAVTRVKPGDFAALTVRRGCGHCLPCAMNRSDMCETGDYKERGIWRMDGYQAEYVTDREQYAVRVPAVLGTIGVLLEPLSIAEKAISESLRLQSSRSPSAAVAPNWIYGRRCLVAGLGPVGLLAALALRLRGVEVYGLDIEDSQSARPKWLEAIGGKYIDGRKVPPDRAAEVIGPMELIFEATGVASLEFDLLDALAQNGVYALTGIPGGDRPIQVPGAELIRRLVLGNQVMVGSVNAARDHFQIAVSDLYQAFLTWGDHVKKLITHRNPPSDFQVLFTKHPADEIKSVIEWAGE